MDSAFLMALAEQVTVTSEVRIAMIYTQQSICCIAQRLYTHMPHIRVCHCPPYGTPAGTAPGVLPAGLLPSTVTPRVPREGTALHAIHHTHKAMKSINEYCIQTIRSMFETTWQKINTAKE